MKSGNRILSIDIMRGLTLLLMLFVNDLNMRVAPVWLGHMPADFDGMGLAASLFYLVTRDSITGTAIAVMVFLTVNILDASGLLSFLDPARPALGIIIQGNVPLIVLTGVLAGVIIRKMKESGNERILTILITLGFLSLAIGFILRNWFLISKIQATPSWGMICSGISFMVFAVIYWLADVKGMTGWAAFVRPPGRHSLTTYLAPDILYHAIWMSAVPLLIYKQSSEPLVVIVGSIAWALLMAGLTALLAKINIKLKL
ncbi:MAG: hypothetical protein P1P83_06050 [Bacteroidales bacterium]|nr:hypothetical protein [Bacteroidales bacterium]MDT8373338.1 hypothetical protein [Bacteroidales bacterium]